MHNQIIVHAQKQALCMHNTIAAAARALAVSIGRAAHHCIVSYEIA